MQTVLLVLAACPVLCYGLSFLLASNYDPREPPLLPAKIPILGHAIGLLRKKAHYYVELSNRYPLPIYTLTMPGGFRVYVINSIECIIAVQRLPKTLAFPPIEAKFAMTVCASSKEANDIVKLNTNGDEGDWGYMVDFYKSLHPTLSPGAGLDAMNRVMIQNVAASLEKLGRHTKGGRLTRIGLVAWLRHEITVATTNSVYGLMNPFQDRNVEDAFWDFQNDVATIVMNVLPTLTARKARRGRGVVSRAFEEYFQREDHRKGSCLVQARYADGRNNKIPIADIARFEVGNVIALLVNTGPAVFWMLFHLFSDQAVLKDCRDEVSAVVKATQDSTGTVIRSLDITMIKSRCPILASTFQEVLRYRSLVTSVRQVMKDTMLNDQYLLKKDSTILMPSIVVHSDASVWGPDVSDFKHKRFLKTKSTKSKPPSAAAFRAFGGGTTLCPGRHFATTEILAVAAMFLMRYELSPVGGYWKAPTSKHTSISSVIMEPDHEIEVDVTPREGSGNGKWAFELGDSEMVFAVTAEDKGEDE